MQIQILMEKHPLEDYSWLESFCLTKGSGELGRLVFRVVIGQESEQCFLQYPGKRLQLKLEKRLIFSGIVESVSVAKYFSRSVAEVVAVSEAVSETEKPAFRIFQDEKHTIGSMLPLLGGKSSFSCFPKKLGACVYQPVALQNQETNFDFAKRLAAEAGTVLWTRDNFDGEPELIIGPYVSDGVAAIKEEDIVCETVCRRPKEQGLRLTLKSYFEIGTLVERAQEKYVVAQLTAELRHEAWLFDYILQPQPQYKVPTKIERTGQPLLTLAGKVSNQDDPEHKGRLQVKFNEDNIEDKEQPRWLPVATPYSGKESGIVFLPDVGDAVRVLMKEDGAVISGASREAVLKEECRQVKDKYIGNNSGQRIFWKEKSLELMSADNKVYLDKDKIELTVGKTKMTMNKDGIILECGDGKMFLTAESITLQDSGSKQQLGPKGIVLEGAGGSKGELSTVIKFNTGGSVNINAAGQVGLNGSSINLG